MQDNSIERYKKAAEFAINRFEAEYLQKAEHIVFKFPYRYTLKMKSKPKSIRFRDFGFEIFETYTHASVPDTSFMSGYAPVLFWPRLTNRTSEIHILSQKLCAKDRKAFKLINMEYTEPAQSEHFESAKEFMLNEYWKLDDESGINRNIYMLEPKELEP